MQSKSIIRRQFDSHRYYYFFNSKVFINTMASRTHLENAMGGLKLISVGNDDVDIIVVNDEIKFNCAIGILSNYKHISFDAEGVDLGRSGPNES